jgi:FKBP-type peptidyl-prolyl cis-trans isomerase
MTFARIPAIAAGRQIPAPADVANPPADATRMSSGPATPAVASRVVSPGPGATHPGAHDLVTVSYTMWAADGTTVDASTWRGQPSRWSMDQLVQGLRIGIGLMVAGETRRLWIPAGMGFEWVTSALVFDIELLRIDAVVDAPTDAELQGPPAGAATTPRGVAFKVLRRSNASERPKPTSTVTINYTGWIGRAVFDDTVGRNEPLVVAVDTLIPGLSDAVQRMGVGEKSRNWIPEALAYTPPGPPRSALLFDLELLAIQHAEAGEPGTVDVRTNSPDAEYILLEPDGAPRPLKGSRTIERLPPGRYRIQPATMRSYAWGVVALPRDMRLAPGERLVITITYRPIIQ